jgi:hypothetical protein
MSLLIERSEVDAGRWIPSGRTPCVRVISDDQRSRHLVYAVWRPYIQSLRYLGARFQVLSPVYAWNAIDVPEELVWIHGKHTARQKSRPHLRSTIVRALLSSPVAGFDQYIREVIKDKTLLAIFEWIILIRDIKVHVLM